jgi:hypothetical protein
MNLQKVVLSRFAITGVILDLLTLKISHPTPTFKNPKQINYYEL